MSVSAPTAPRGSFGVLPHVSQVVPQDPHSLLPVAGHGHAPARFVLAAPTDLPKQPLRLYASLKSADSMEERVDLLLQEMERAGAFERANIFIGAPTGGGHVNPVAMELVERMAKGDVASVGVQYGTLPSVLSFGKVGHASNMLDRLLQGIKQRIRERYPDGGGPRVLLYGESLGGWASQRTLDRSGARVEARTGRPADPLDEAGVDRAAWVGIPGFSRFKGERLGPGGLQAISGIAQLRELSPEARARARAWNLSHFDDPVHRVDLRLIWKRPAWLPKDGENPAGVDPNQRWRPLLTFADTAKLVFTTANKEVPGVFTDHGHDYRKELPELLREAFGFTDITDAELARITEQVRQSEVWIMEQEWK